MKRNETQLQRAIVGGFYIPTSDWFILVHVTIIPKWWNSKQEVLLFVTTWMSIQTKMWCIVKRRVLYVVYVFIAVAKCCTFTGVQSAVFITMFRTAAKMLSVASTSSFSRRILSIRYYCKRTPTKLRLSEAVSGSKLGANVQVQVTFT